MIFNSVVGDLRRMWSTVERPNTPVPMMTLSMLLSGKNLPVTNEGVELFGAFKSVWAVELVFACLARGRKQRTNQCLTVDRCYTPAVYITPGEIN